MEECLHNPCTCEVTGDGPFCSPECEEAARAAEPLIECTCPHDTCGGREEID